ncbi:MULTISPECIES: DUF881 domain-containing protein [Caloramator]|uniref:Division initiation protein n=2 Tax=Caloramator TaxID=44258 RepID=I7K777_9CLOT|nr:MULTISPECIES: DUF881 domain-containing protein [Caloramator]MDO6354406.1 DUF881 domain-containing protein [Caloramator sp. CAR-1]CCJ33364.1 Division initiation protein [Caloramator australicus RC3]
MNNRSSQLWIGFICVILGFMVSYQLRYIKTPRYQYTTRQFENLVKETEDLKKQRDELLIKTQELQMKIDEIEKSVASSNKVASQMKEELDQLRLLSGLTDVEGPGIEITITPVNDLSNKQASQVYYKDLIDIVNELNSAGAEAISINDERFVGRTQIRQAGLSIKINDSKFDPTQPFVIKAIGDPAILEGAFKMPDSIIEILKKIGGFEIKIVRSDKIKILKYNKNLEYKYIQRK